ncbi:MAG: hypothetical protein V1827_04235 [Candidatus Micrarchaeota archaeon]
MKNPLPLAFLSILIIILSYILYLAFFPQEVDVIGDSHRALYCTDGEKRACTIGACSGISACSGGAWGGCSWERICEPGSRELCIQDGCAYALKECDGCGTSWGPCQGLDGS